MGGVCEGTTHRVGRLYASLLSKNSLVWSGAIDLDSDLKTITVSYEANDW